LLNGYNGIPQNFMFYCVQHKKEEIKRQVFENYVATCVGGLAGAKKQYNEILADLNRYETGENFKTGDEIKEEWLEKFC